MKNTFVFKHFITTVTIFSSICIAETANATILTFQDLGLSNGGIIPEMYGDNVNSLNDGIGSYEEGNGFTPNVVVDYRTVSVSNGSTISNNLRYWDSGYGDLADVGYASVNGALAEISLTPDAGYFVRLNSFDLAGFPGSTQPNQTVRILDKDFNILVDYSLFDVTGSGSDMFSPDILASDTIRIQYGPSFNTGIDNINFDQQAVPEPLTILGAGTAIAFGTGFKRKLAKAKKK